MTNTKLPSIPEIEVPRPFEYQTEKYKREGNIGEEIVATFFGKGKTHDYKLYQLSRTRLGKQIRLHGDLGYWGLQTKSVNVILPQKNSKLHQLSKAEKKANRALSAKRVKVENVIRRLKIFRILSERYRHRRKRFGLRFNLIAGLHNYELKLKS